MKHYRVRVPPEVGISIRHLHPHIKSKVRMALEELERDPYLGKALKGRLRGLNSYRVGHYRIVYEIRSEKVLIDVVDVEERKIVYEKVAQLVRSL